MVPALETVLFFVLFPCFLSSFCFSAFSVTAIPLGKELAKANVSYGTIAAKLKEVLCCLLAQSIIIKQQTAGGRYDFRKKHSRVTGISNNAVLRKRHPSFRSLRLIHYSCFVILFGKLGYRFAATINAAPMTIRKNEKNWPRVNGPINSASGSRKFSTTIRKIA